jgi:TatA/E family protein of Tat protein translocase
VAVLAGRHDRHHVGDVRVVRRVGGIDRGHQVGERGPVERRPHRVPAGRELFGGEPGRLQVALDVEAEVARVARAGAALPRRPRLRHRAQRCRRGGRGLRPVDRPLLLHGGDHGVAASLRSLRVLAGVVRARALHHAGEQGGLGHGELVGRGVEVDLRGGADPVGAAAEVHDVQVAVEDLLLRQLAVEPHRQLGLRDLAGDARCDRGAPCGVGLGRDVELVVLDVLLGQRRATLLRAAVGVVDERPGRPDGVDTTVVVEAAILDRDDRRLHRRCDPVIRDRDPKLVVEVRQGHTGRIGDNGCRRRHTRPQIVGDDGGGTADLTGQHPYSAHDREHHPGQHDPCYQGECCQAADSGSHTHPPGLSDPIDRGADWRTASRNRGRAWKMGELSPWHWAVVILVAALLFGAKRLPDAARSIGQSARILKAELRAEDKPESTTST